MRGEPITIRAFLKDMRLLAPVTLGLLLVLWALGLFDGLSLWELLLVALVLQVGLGPLIWLYRLRTGDNSAAAWKWLGLSCLWAIGCFAAVAVVSSLLD